ncbi:MAG: peptidoglycan-binding protein [Silicimonas sp.]|nr:peptidoglycan-binding protein [Silicimonas sp.]
MRLLQVCIAVCGFSFWAVFAHAQAWVQIEAQPSEASALERAADYASRLPDVNAFRTGTNWHVIALGPYGEDEARLKLLELRVSREVPSDAFVSDGRSFQDQVFGDGRQAALPGSGAETPADPLPPLEPGEETVTEARQGERQLSREERAELQVALKWEGFYNSTIDASFGPGTRRAMAAWQEAQRYEPTGVLTTLQRRELIEGYQSVVRSLDIRPLVDPTLGIEVDIPAQMVEFDRYDAPFAHFKPTTDDGVRLVLISQSGDTTTLAALYDILQTLEVAPVDGPRALRRDSFTIEGSNDKITSYIYARVASGTVKGYALIWPQGDDKRFRLALSAMQESFRTNSGVLPDNAGSGPQNIDLLSGLEIRRAERARSGFFIDGEGTVLTTYEAVRQCGRITLNEATEADIAAEDTGLGLAILKPRQTLAPLSVARLAAVEPRLQSDVAVSGFSFGGVLSAPSLTYGTLADLKGLNGDDRVQRLSVISEPGDAGGPVFDGSGAVMGMLLDRGASARKLPDDVAFAADAPVLAEFLSANGVNPAAADPGEEMAPEDLTLLAADLTVLVSCWN